jgi:hypothetical protein
MTLLDRPPLPARRRSRWGAEVAFGSPSSGSFALDAVAEVETINPS